MKKPHRPERANPDRQGRSSAHEGERIAKRLARAGISSRRDAELMVIEGRVSVNGKVLETPAVNVRPDDRIEIDGKPIPAIERTRLFLFHKPTGMLTTSRDPEGRRTVFDALPDGLPRLVTVGRLDFNTEGLLLMTNDGGLARALELPSTGWLRRYRVRAHGTVDQAKLDTLRDGIAVDGVLYGPVEATIDRVQGTNTWITVGIREGKNREVRNVLGALGLEVNRLIRISYGPFQLGDLAEGAILEVRGRMLRDQLGEKLVEQSGANFDAPIVKEFSNREVKAGDRKPDEPARPARRMDRQDKRDAALSRLDTRAPRSRGPAGGDEGKRRDDPLRNRAAHVWMAPGARPLGPRKQQEEEERRAQEKKRDWKAKPPRPGKRERQENASRGEDRKDYREYKPRGEGEFGGRGSAPAKSRGYKDRPEGARGGDRPSGEARSRGFKDRPDGDYRPRREGEEGGRKKPYSGRPSGENRGRGDGPKKPYSGRPSADGKPSGPGKPDGRSRKPYGSGPGPDKPRGGKPYSGRQDGAKHSGDRPRGGKPSSGGGRSGGGKPGGKRGGGADRRR